MIPEALAESIRIFGELGWEGADETTALTLPLGTPEQQKIAKAGLSSGAWGESGRITENSWGYVSGVGRREALLGAFALRLGVSTKRAAEIFPSSFTYQAQGELLGLRPDVVASFTKQRRTLARYAPAITAAIVANSDLEIPDSIDYLTRWAHLTARAFTDTNERYRTGPYYFAPEFFHQRFAEHLRAALTSGVQTGAEWTQIIGMGVEQELIEKAEAQELTLTALERAGRPTDRKVFLEVLQDDLGATAEFFLARAGTALSVLSYGEDPLINRLVPILVASGDDDLILQALLMGLGAKSAKALAGVLTTALDLKSPSPAVTEVAAESVTTLVTHKDKKVAKLATQVLSAWQVEVEAPAAPESAPVLGLWQPTPPRAEVSRLDVGAASVENLTALTSQMLAERPDGLTLTVERFLAAANAMAHTDPEAARRVLKAVKRQWGTGLHAVAGWVSGGEINGLDTPATNEQDARIVHLTRARTAAVFSRLGDVPTLLSTPSFADYRTDPADLADRLEAYGSTPATEADLQVALTRIDRTLLTPPVRARLEESSVAIVLQSGEHLPQSVGDILTLWFASPYDHPGFDRDGIPLETASHPALDLLPLRREGRSHSISVCPTWLEAVPDWADLSSATLRAVGNGVEPSTLLVHFDRYEASVDYESPIAAWQNGVLEPSVPSATRLVWNGTISSVASRARAWEELAHAGLLSVMWPLASDVVTYLADAPRLAPGLAELMEFLQRMVPEVHAAIAAGLTTTESFALPGVRAIAARPGSSRAVAVARELVALVPHIEVSSEDPRASEMPDAEFAEVWPTYPDSAVLPDGATIALSVTNGARRSGLMSHITLASGETVDYQRAWLYGVANRGRATISSDSFLLFDEARGELVVANNSTATDAATPRSHTLVALLCVAQQQPDPEFYYFPYAVRSGYIGVSRIAAAIDTLLAHAEFNPYLVVRKLSQYPEVISAFYPVITRGIRHASTLGAKPPVWLVRLIDVATTFAPVLREAARRGAMNSADAAWPGLVSIAQTTSSAAVKRKAAALIDLLGLNA